MRCRLLAATLAAALVGVAGCSGDTSTPGLSDGSARQLQADVLAVTRSAAAHNWTVARTELDTLRADLAAARSAGSVSTARSSSIEAAIAAVSSDLSAASAPTTTPQTTPPKTTPAPTTSHPKQSSSKGKHGGGGDGGGDGG